MHIDKKNAMGDLLVLSVSGALDNDSSVHFRSEIESCKRQGWHRIVVDLSGVSYISSAGIAALLAAKEQLEHLSGLFGIFNPVPQVATVLEQVRLLNVLACDPRTAQAARAAGSMTMAISSSTRMASGEGIDMEIYPLGVSQVLTCRLFGDPQSLFNPDLQPSQRVSCDTHSCGIGTGSLGRESDEPIAPIGEIIAIAGAVAQSPPANGGLPDYSVAAEEFIPVARLLYGIQWSGELPTLIRFEPTERGTTIGLSTLVRQAMRHTDSDAAAFVILADCAGLVGAQLRGRPDPAIANPREQFLVPEIRNWLSFSPERLHRHNLALIAGVAAARDSDHLSALRPFVRPLGPEQDLWGHFHSVVFPYKPLKKRTLKMHNEIAELFGGGALEDVLHLLRDDRPISGSGESELLSGACWIGSLGRVNTEEVKG